MKREQFFSKGGYYPFIVQTDILLHSEAINLGIQAMSCWLKRCQPHKPVKVLDLACGGMPIAISDIMGHFPDVKFIYTGIDINPDQITLAKAFEGYPNNVIETHLIEGNAWDFRGLELDDGYDVIFSGMNFHHGTVDELYFLSLQLDQLLAADGFIFSHDVYRPITLPYIERPANHPQNPQESFQLIDASALAQLDIPSFDISKIAFGQHTEDWRETFIQRLHQYLQDHNAKPEYIKQTEEHVYQRDFAVSIPEMTQIINAVGFLLTDITPRGLRHRLADYYAFLVIEKARPSTSH